MLNSLYICLIDIMATPDEIMEKSYRDYILSKASKEPVKGVKANRIVIKLSPEAQREADARKNRGDDFRNKRKYTDKPMRKTNMKKASAKFIEDSLRARLGIKVKVTKFSDGTMNISSNDDLKLQGRNAVREVIKRILPTATLDFSDPAHEDLITEENDIENYDDPVYADGGKYQGKAGDIEERGTGNAVGRVNPNAFDEEPQKIPATEEQSPKEPVGVQATVYKKSMKKAWNEFKKIGVSESDGMGTGIGVNGGFGLNEEMERNDNKKMPQNIQNEKGMKRRVVGNEGYTDIDTPHTDSFYLPGKVKDEEADASDKTEAKQELSSDNKVRKKQPFNTGMTAQATIG